MLAQGARSGRCGVHGSGIKNILFDRSLHLAALRESPQQNILILSLSLHDSMQDHYGFTVTSIYHAQLHNLPENLC